MASSLIASLLALVLIVSTIEAYKGTVGDVFFSTRVNENEARGIFLFTDIKVVEGVVYKFTLRAVTTNPIWLQIWRLLPTTDGSLRYQLVGQKRVVPTVLNRVVDVDLFPNKYIFTNDNDILGIYNEESTCPLAYEFTPQNPAPIQYYGVKEGDIIETEMVKTFQVLAMPWAFSISVSYDTDAAPYRIPFTGELTTTTTPIPTTMVPNYPPNEGTIEYAGNGLHDKLTAISRGARGIYLLPHIGLREGVVVKIYIYVVGIEPISIQIWRPMNERDAYELVGQHRYVPDDSIPGLKEIILGDGEYLFTKSGDQIGYLNEGYLGSVGFKFLSNPYEEGPWSAGYANATLWEEVIFDQSWLPYDFAIGIKYDTLVDYSKYGYPPTRPASTPVPTQPPVPALTDKVVGKNFLQWTDKFIETQARATFIIKDIMFTEAARVTSFYLYAMNSGSVDLQVWRADESRDEYFMLVGKISAEITESDKFVRIDVPESDDIRVRAGDYLGFSTMSDVGVIGYRFEEATLYVSSQYQGMERNDEHKFQSFNFPYHFSIAATYTDILEPTEEPATSPESEEEEDDKTTPKSTEAPNAASSTSENVIQTTTSSVSEKLDPESSTTSATSTKKSSTPSPTPETSTTSATSTQKSSIASPTPETSTVSPTPTPVSSTTSPKSSLETSTTSQKPMPETSTTSPKSSIETSTTSPKPRPETSTTSPETSTTSLKPSPETSSKKPEPSTKKPEPSTKKPEPSTKKPEPSTKTPKPESSSKNPNDLPKFAAATAEEDNLSFLRDMNFQLAMFIWLIVMTCAFLFLCCYVVCCKSKRQQEEAKMEANRNSFLYNNDLHSRQGSNYKKYGQMRDNEVIDYFNPTIGSYPGIKRDDSMKRPLTRVSSGAESMSGNLNNGNNIEADVKVESGNGTHM